jgi:hypothetical protein
MSTELDQARSLAERIARKVSAGNSSRTAPSSQPRSQLNAEIAAVRASINDLQKRLVQLESRTRGESSAPPIQSFVPPTHSPWLAGVNAAVTHASEERFGVEEAVVNELVDYFQSEKACSLDPSGKPCDHCALCSSRGF